MMTPNETLTAAAKVAGLTNEETERLTRHCPADVWCKLAAKLLELDAVVSRLPKTADGVPYVDGDTVYCPAGHEIAQSCDGMPLCGECLTDPSWPGAGLGRVFPADDCYSTQGASLVALAARWRK